MAAKASNVPGADDDDVMRGRCRIVRGRVALRGTNFRFRADIASRVSKKAAAGAERIA
jgi:hypothetical protein